LGPGRNQRLLLGLATYMSKGCKLNGVSDALTLGAIIIAKKIGVYLGKEQMR